MDKVIKIKSSDIGYILPPGKYKIRDVIEAIENDISMQKYHISIQPKIEHNNNLNKYK